MSAVSLLHTPNGWPGISLAWPSLKGLGGGGLGERTADISESMKTILPR